MPIRSPYQTLGVPPTATDAQVRVAYRRLVQLHHPDHNQGSPESTRRFEEVQEAYAQVLRERRRPAPPPPPRPPAEDLNARLSDLERQVRDAHAARERARRAAREAMASAADRERPTDEELGYVTTEDSFTKILMDGLDELASKLDRHLKKER